MFEDFCRKLCICRRAAKVCPCHLPWALSTIPVDFTGRTHSEINGVQSLATCSELCSRIHESPGDAAGIGSRTLFTPGRPKSSLTQPNFVHQRPNLRHARSAATMKLSRELADLSSELCSHYYTKYHIFFAYGPS